MKQLISIRDVEDLIRKGGDPRSMPADALYTPAARDRLREWEDRGRRPGTEPASPKPGPAPAATELETWFASTETNALKEQICDVGRRLWQRAYVDGNGGNLSIRADDHRVLCTPTLVSKGFMKPGDVCLVDLEAAQLAGAKRATSEIRMHLAIMKGQPKARACVHCHPPYATAFAVAGVTPPTCMVPEIEVFCGEIGLAPYETPGTWEMANKVAVLADKHNTILMANHGVVAWGASLEEAYFKMEILEAYCRTVLVTAQLGVEPKTFSPAQLKDLLTIKQKLGIPDRRIGLKEAELCDNGDWRPGVTCRSPAENPEPAATDPEVERIVQTITDLIAEKLR